MPDYSLVAAISHPHLRYHTAGDLRRLLAQLDAEADRCADMPGFTGMADAAEAIEHAQAIREELKARANAYWRGASERQFIVL